MILQWVTVGDVDVDIGANPSAEEADEGTESTSRKVVDVVDSFRLVVSCRFVFMGCIDCCSCFVLTVTGYDRSNQDMTRRASWATSRYHTSRPSMALPFTVMQCTHMRLVLQPWLTKIVEKLPEDKQAEFKSKAQAAIKFLISKIKDLQL